MVEGNAFYTEKIVTRTNRLDTLQASADRTGTTFDPEPKEKSASLPGIPDKEAVIVKLKNPKGLDDFWKDVVVSRINNKSVKDEQSVVEEE